MLCVIFRCVFTTLFSPSSLTYFTLPSLSLVLLSLFSLVLLYLYSSLLSLGLLSIHYSIHYFSCLFSFENQVPSVNQEIKSLAAETEHAADILTERINHLSKGYADLNSLSTLSPFGVNVGAVRADGSR